MRIKTGDTVKVLYGRDAGKTGKVLKIIPKSEQVVVEGMNLHKRHLKGDGRTKVSEIVTITKPMPVAKLQLVDDSGKPTRVAYKIDGGKKIRVSKKTGKEIGAVEAKAKSAKEEKKETKKDIKKDDKKKTTKSKTSKK